MVGNKLCYVYAYGVKYTYSLEPAPLFCISWGYQIVIIIIYVQKLIPFV